MKRTTPEPHAPACYLAWLAATAIAVVVWIARMAWN